MLQTGESDLATALSALPEATQAILRAHRFDRQLLLELAERMLSGGIDNHVKGALTSPTPDDVIELPAPGSNSERELRELGQQALSQGECALVVLAGGMATRMGGVVKALVDALPGRTFLDLRLGEQRHLGKLYGKTPPLWLMTSHATQEGIEAALSHAGSTSDVATFRQGLSVRLTPDGHLFLDRDGLPSLHAPGHGDLPSALAASGLLTAFVERGGRYVLVTNLDNLGGGLDPVLIGLHLARGVRVGCEVVGKLPGDRGGIPVRLDGRPVVLEEFRIPPTFDPNQVRVFNVNSFSFDARTLAELDFPWTYFQVEKTVDGKKAIQFERLLGEVTSYVETTYFHVPREGERARFLPVKDHDELTARQAEISLIAQSRGMLAGQ